MSEQLSDQEIQDWLEGLYGDDRMLGPDDDRPHPDGA